MPPKRKVTKRRLKRSLPPQQSSGVNPLGIGLGAAIGAGVGRYGAGVQAKRKVAAGSSRAYARDTEKYANGRYQKMDQNERVMSASEAVYNDEYRKMPRANDGALERFKTNDKANRTSPSYKKEDGYVDYDRAESDARRTSGLSKKGQAAYEDKKYRKGEGIRQKVNNQAGGLYDDAVAMRTKRKAGKYTRAGGAAGAALSLIAQLVAAEMRKKK